MNLKEHFNKSITFPVSDLVDYPTELLLKSMTSSLREIIASYFYGHGLIDRDEAAACAEAYITAWLQAWEKQATHD